MSRADGLRREAKLLEPARTSGTTGRNLKGNGTDFQGENRGIPIMGLLPEKRVGPR
jgi:hypothetical protein